MTSTSLRRTVCWTFSSNTRLWWAILFGLTGCSLLLSELAAAQTTPQADVAYAQGIIAYDDRDYLEALEHFRRAVALAPERPHVQLYLGLSLSRIGEYQEAIAVLEKALQLDPGMHRAHHPLGLAYFQEQRYQEALAQFTLAVQGMPNRAATQFYLGYTHYLLQHYQEALPFLQRASELDAALALRAGYYRGVALYALERDPEAVEAFQVAVSTAPDSLTAQSAQRYIEAIDKRAWARQRTQWQGAVSFQYDDNVMLEPNDINLSRQGDGRTVFALLGRFLPVRRGPWRLGAEYALYQSLHFDLHEFDTQSHTARLLARWKSGRVTLQAATDYTLTLVDSDRFSDWVTLQSSATIRQTEALFANVSVRYRFSDYFNQFIPPDPTDPTIVAFASRPGRDVRDRDGQSLRAGFDQYFAFDKNRSYARLSYHFEASRNDGSDWEYDSHAVGFGLQTPLRWGVTLNLAWGLQRWEYLHSNSFSAAPLAVLTPEDNLSRKDNRLSGSVTLTRDLGRSLTLAAGYLYTSHWSNLDFFSYRRNILSLALTGRY